MTLSAADPRSCSLREAANQLNVPEGWRVEIVGSGLVVSPTPLGRHAGIIDDIAEQLARQLRDDRAALQNIAVEGVDDGEDYTIPDLTVLPAAVKFEDDWLFPADIVDLAVEVVSLSNPNNDTVNKVQEYAEWGIPVYLLVDPRDGGIVTYSDPVDGEYRAQHKSRFGEAVQLPKPLADVSIDTAAFTRYGSGRP
ncbi:Uma2 family endonuclease [Allonocardiopsis opalescens]|uniref:Putative restriction endonuclease n=1 Tax=Allonocardiopsis opalescens TaxID=1144618 RepID=A0A2T0Q817_9ACTN|nr:Uma2 family endonuclease [Allonocardiopsis opalescens]PRY00001.1 putative restriction endonuclease [Allonocardiopsis opalescens]